MAAPLSFFRADAPAASGFRRNALLPIHGLRTQVHGLAEAMPPALRRRRDGRGRVFSARRAFLSTNPLLSKQRGVPIRPAQGGPGMRKVASVEGIKKEKDLESQIRKSHYGKKRTSPSLREEIFLKAQAKIRIKMSQKSPTPLFFWDKNAPEIFAFYSRYLDRKERRFGGGHSCD